MASMATAPSRLGKASKCSATFSASVIHLQRDVQFLGYDLQDGLEFGVDFCVFFEGNEVFDEFGCLDVSGFQVLGSWCTLDAGTKSSGMRRSSRSYRSARSSAGVKLVTRITRGGAEHGRRIIGGMPYHRKVLMSGPVKVSNKYTPPCGGPGHGNTCAWISAPLALGCVDDSSEYVNAHCASYGVSLLRSSERGWSGPSGSLGGIKDLAARCRGAPSPL